MCITNSKGSDQRIYKFIFVSLERTSNNNNINNNNNNNHLYFTRVTQSNTRFDFRCGKIKQLGWDARGPVK